MSKEHIRNGWLWKHGWCSRGEHEKSLENSTSCQKVNKSNSGTSSWKLDDCIDFKAYFHYLLYFTKRKSFKGYEKCFLFHLKIFLQSGDIQFFVIFSFLSTFFGFNGSDENGKIMKSCIGLNKLANVIFEITRIWFFIKSSKLRRWYLDHIKANFSKHVLYTEEKLLIPGTFCFS